MFFSVPGFLHSNSKAYKIYKIYKIFMFVSFNKSKAIKRVLELRDKKVFLEKNYSSNCVTIKSFIHSFIHSFLHSFLEVILHI